MTDDSRPIPAVGLSSAHDGDRPRADHSSSASSRQVLLERVEKLPLMLAFCAQQYTQDEILQAQTDVRDLLALLVERETPQREDKAEEDTRVDEPK